jgi:hypothetical protein
MTTAERCYDDVRVEADHYSKTGSSSGIGG